MGLPSFYDFTSVFYTYLIYDILIAPSTLGPVTPPEFEQMNGYNIPPEMIATPTKSQEFNSLIITNVYFT